MKPNLLSITYDRTLLMARHLMLQESGFFVVSAGDFKELKQGLAQSGYDVFILGHSLPSKEKLRVFHLLRDNSASVPILELYNSSPDLDTGFSLSSHATPEDLLTTVNRIIQEHLAKARHQGGAN